jgi:hypothetical protein
VRLLYNVFSFPLFYFFLVFVLFLFFFFRFLYQFVFVFVFIEYLNKKFAFFVVFNLFTEQNNKQ